MGTDERKQYEKYGTR